MDQQIFQDMMQYDLASIDRCNSIQSLADLLDGLMEQAIPRELERCDLEPNL
jgi:hypothetical protein